MSGKSHRPKQKSPSDYQIIGYSFLAAAVGMFFFETTRGLGIAFFAMGITFVLIKPDDPAGDNKRSQKK